MKVSKFNYTTTSQYVGDWFNCDDLPKSWIHNRYKPEFMSNHQWLKAFIKTEVEKQNIQIL